MIYRSYCYKSLAYNLKYERLISYEGVNIPLVVVIVGGGGREDGGGASGVSVIV